MSELPGEHGYLESLQPEWASFLRSLQATSRAIANTSKVV
jgi:hypothetical protein